MDEATDALLHGGITQVLDGPEGEKATKETDFQWKEPLEAVK